MGPSFKVFTKKEYDLFFEEFKQIPKETPPEQIIQQLYNTLRFNVSFLRKWTGTALSNFRFYRIRTSEVELSDERKGNKQEYSYPPLPNKRGRLNAIGTQVFYSSGDAHTTIHETAKQIISEPFVYLSKWGLKDCVKPFFVNQMFFSPTDKDSYSAILAQGIRERFDEMVAHLPETERENFAYALELYEDLFTSNGENFYHITAAIASNSFATSQRIVGTEVIVEVPIIAYPSVAKNKTAPNFALRKDFVDKYLCLKEVDQIMITELNEEKVKYNPQKRGVMRDGVLSWIDFNIKLETIHYDKAGYWGCTEPDKFISLNNPSEISLTSCCKDHGFSIKEYIEASGIIERFISELNEVPQQLPDFELITKVDFAFRFSPNKDLYNVRDISPTGKIKYIGMPITYVMGFF
jgi:hypothetical protein